MRNPAESGNIESFVDVQYDVVDNFKRQVKHRPCAAGWNKKLDFTHLQFMDRHRLCRILRGYLTCTNRLATRFYSTFQPRPALRSPLPLTLGQIQSEAETLLRQEVNGSSIEGVSEGNSRDVAVRGWIKTLRRQKHVAFLNLSDGTERDLKKGFQVVIEEPSLLEAIQS
jgi:hypothetical protein